MNEPRFRSDRPIDGGAHDALERTGFSRRLAEQIHAWDGHESLVIGIHGDWGAGKSSVKNIVVERLDELGEQKPKVVHFNPWMVSGEQHVAEAFFLEMELILASENLGQDGKRRASAWRKYARHFETAAKLSDALDVVLPVVGGIPGIGKSMAGRIREASGLMEHAADRLQGATKPIEDQKREMREFFKQLNRKLVVVIDDIDRLTHEEIRIIFRLVKATSDFPNTVFLLLFQKSTVEDALNSISGGQGKAFLQKIVQVELGLPSVPQNQLAEFWETGIKDILGRETWGQIFENQRVLDFWFGGLRSYFVNLRDVTRFLNSFGFIAAGFYKDGVWEIDPTDLLAIEAIRLFDPEVYDLIADSKGVLTQHSEDLHRDNLRTLAEELLKAGSESSLNEKELKEFLSVLFPILQKVWSNTGGFGDSYWLKWKREKRACIEEFFDAYFRFALPQGQLSEVVVARILSKRADRGALREEIRQMQIEGKLFELLDRLEAEEEFIADPSMAYVLALSDLCDYWPDAPRKYLMAWQGSIYAHRAAYRFLRTIEENSPRSAAVVRLIRETEGLLIAGEWIIDSTEDKDRREWPKIDETTATQLKQEWVERVRHRQSDDAFFEIHSLSRVIRLWAEWGGVDEVRDWLDNLSPSRLLPFLFSMASSTTSEVGYGTKTTRWISWKILERYGNHQFWTQKARCFNECDLKEEDSNTVKMLEESLERWKEGKNDSDGHFLRDF
jgi:hypothetical protein